jgi:hypothetical protein
MNDELPTKNRLPPEKGDGKPVKEKLPIYSKMKEPTFDLLNELSVRGVLFESANENVKDPYTPLEAAKRAYAEKYARRMPCPVESLSYHVNTRFVYLYRDGLRFIWDHLDETELNKSHNLTSPRNFN